MQRSGEATVDSVPDHWSVTDLPNLDLIRSRLRDVFPASLNGRAWAIAERAAKSIFVFLYTLAVEGVTDHRVRPAMVTTMSDGQAARHTYTERVGWWNEARRPRIPAQSVPGRWYAENTREPIRDETFRVWKEYGALLEDAVPTTSSLPRYRLARDFADLFDPSLGQTQFGVAIQAWQRRHLTPAALARMALVQHQATSLAGADVRFPDGATRLLAVGPSTPLLKAAVEEFAPRFLRQPVVLAVNESRQRLVHEDADQFRRIGLTPDPRVMPDLLLADVGAPHGDLVLVFLECVATGGAMTRARLSAIEAWLYQQGFADARLGFGSVFGDRSDAAFRALVGELTWGTFAWFASEPGGLLVLMEDATFEPRQALDAQLRFKREQ